MIRINPRACFTSPATTRRRHDPELHGAERDAALLSDPQRVHHGVRRDQHLPGGSGRRADHQGQRLLQHVSRPLDEARHRQREPREPRPVLCPDGHLERPAEQRSEHPAVLQPVHRPDRRQPVRRARGRSTPRGCQRVLDHDEAARPRQPRRALRRSSTGFLARRHLQPDRSAATNERGELSRRSGSALRLEPFSGGTCWRASGARRCR